MKDALQIFQSVYGAKFQPTALCLKESVGVCGRQCHVFAVDYVEGITKHQDYMIVLDQHVNLYNRRKWRQDDAIFHLLGMAMNSEYEEHLNAVPQGVDKDGKLI